MSAVADVTKFPHDSKERASILDMLERTLSHVDAVKEQSLVANISTVLSSHGRALAPVAAAL